MPLVTTDRINTNDMMLADIAKWVFKYGRNKVAYQYISNTVFVYKVPTIGNMLDLEVAEAQSQLVATDTFLKAISLSKIPRMRPQHVMDLMGKIVKEHFPAGEDGLRNSLLLSTSRHMSTLVGALDTHLKELSAELTSRDLTYNEVLELLSIKQILTQRPIMKGSMPKRLKQRRGTNVSSKRA